MEKNGKSFFGSQMLRTILMYFVLLQAWRLYFIYFNGLSPSFDIFYNALRLDFSMVCGVVLITLPLLLTDQVIHSRVSHFFWKASHAILWILISLVEFSSTLLYPEWGNTLDARAISYLTHPREVWASVHHFLPGLQVIWALILTAAGLGAIQFFCRKDNRIKQLSWRGYLQILLFAICTFIGLRGGLQKLPVTPSDAFQSMSMKENFASVNKVWYFLYSVIQQKEYVPLSSAADISEFYRQYKGNDSEISKSNESWKGKNIVLVVLEGWSADMVSYLGGKEKVTPFFDSLATQSKTVTEMYASGFRTDQGILALLSGTPSVGGENLLNNTLIVDKLPSLPALFNKAGYHTSFVYGGDMNFANMDIYIRSLGFKKVKGAMDFKDQSYKTEWGIPDHIVLSESVGLMDSLTSPFFTTVLLLSSHTPFEIPWKNQFGPTGEPASDYKASVLYSDQSLRLFFSLIEDKSWKENTVFIITTDHGSVHSGAAGLEDPNRFKIPAIIYNPCSDNPDNGRISSVANQSDLPATIASIAGLDAAVFPFSRNIFSTDTNRIACWSTDVYAACSHDTERGANPGVAKSRNGLLFLDMIKSWLAGI